VFVPMRTLEWILPRIWLLPWLRVRIISTVVLNKAISELSVKCVFRRCRIRQVRAATSAQIMRYTM
jgi:hypothetical protein